jgi:hypothetical protein
MECRMICRASLLLAGSFVMGCAPAFPPKPELPPISAQMGTTGAHERSAPVIPKPDLSTVSSEVRAAANPATGSARVASPGHR